MKINTNVKKATLTAVLLGATILSALTTKYQMEESNIAYEYYNELHNVVVDKLATYQDTAAFTTALSNACKTNANDLQAGTIGKEEFFANNDFFKEERFAHESLMNDAVHGESYKQAIANELEAEAISNEEKKDFDIASAGTALSAIATICTAGSLFKGLKNHTSRSSRNTSENELDM